ADTDHKAIRQPVVKERVYGVKYSAQEFFLEMAKRVGFYEDYIKNINKNFKLKKYALDPKNPNITPRDYVRAVWQETTGKPWDYALEHAFVGKHKKPADMYHHGIEKHYKGPGKPKINLYADQLLGTFDKVAETKRKHNIAAIDLDKYKVALSPIPRKEHGFPTPHREAKDYPLYLTTYKRMYRNQAGNMAFNPILNNLGPDTDHNFMLIQKQTAKKLGIREGDRVIIETRVGKVESIARVVEGQHPEVVSVSYHYGHIGSAYPDWARKGTWINPVLELHPDLIAGMNSFNDTKCKVYKA
ncbi:MAG: molybdopterin oxidoreductase, partial [Gammaproteobacteria bacterium]